MNRALQRDQLVPRIDTELSLKRVAGRREDTERICVAFAAMERQHELPGKSLACGRRRDQPHELPDQVRVPAESEVCLDARFERCGAKLFEAGTGGGGGGTNRKAAEHRSAPDRQSVRQRRGD